MFCQEEPLIEILEYLIPKRTYGIQWKEETTGDEPDQDNKEKQQQDDTDNKLYLSEKDESDETSKTDIEKCSVTEIDERMASIVEKMQKLALEYECHQEIRAKKLNCGTSDS